MNVSELAIRRPVTTCMVFLSFLVIGVISMKLLPLEYFPSVDAPFVLVQVPYQGASPEQVELEITRPIEEVLATLGQIQDMQSTSRPDRAEIFVLLDFDVDVAIMALKAREKIDAIRDQLPSDIQRINILKFSTSDQAVLTLRISSQRDLSDAYELLDRRLKRPLERLPGVAQVKLQGVEPKEIRIELDVNRISAHGISLQELNRQLQNVNFSASAGLISDGNLRYRLNPVGEYQSIDEIGDLLINQTGLRLRDIATIVYGSPRRTYGRHLDRHYAIGLEIFRERGANLVDVGARTLAEIEKIRKDPAMQGIEIFFLENQAEGVVNSLMDLGNAGLLGALLSFAVLFYFLRNIATTAMVAAAVPISLTIALGVMYFLGYSLNILSMMGLMLAVGMLVDNAVVVSESIFQEKLDNPGDPMRAAKQGVSKVSMAVTGGTFTSAIVFLPMIFGEQNMITIFLSHVAIAICVSLLASLIIAQTIIPLLASRMTADITLNENSFVNTLKYKYGRLLSWTLAHRWISVGVLFLVVVSGFIPMKFVDIDMFPVDDTRSLFLRYNLHQEYPLNKVEPAINRIEEYLYSNQTKFEIRAVYSYFDESGNAQSSILLTKDDDAILSSSEIKEMIRENLPKIAVGAPTFDQNKTGAEKVRVSIRGASTSKLRSIATDVARNLSLIEGIEDVKPNIGHGQLEVSLEVDRQRASKFGLTVEEIAQTVSIGLRGTNLREFRSADGEIPIRLLFENADKTSIEKLKSLLVQREDGEKIPLYSLVDLEQKDVPVSIARNNRKTSVTVEITLKDTNIEEVKPKIKKVLNAMNFTQGYSWDFGRAFEQENETQEKMMLNIVLAILMIYIVMAALFESLIFPAAIVTSIGFSIFGVFWLFLVTGTTFSLMAMIGILILIGVVVNNGIVLLDHINQLRHQKMNRNDAIIQAGRDRLRPILMTVSTTVIGLIPLCIGDAQLGGNGPAYYPMARAIVGGLVFSTLVSLMVLPTIYVILDDLRIWANTIIRSAKIGGALPRPDSPVTREVP